MPFQLLDGVDAIDFSGLTSQLTSAISGATVLQVIGASIVAPISIFFVVWGSRKIIRSLRHALHGRLG